MPERPLRRLFRPSLAVVVAALALIGPAAPAATASSVTASDAGACEVVAGELSWGFKESFRAYISGSIAHGEWTTFDGASYETPKFSWTGATGSFDADTSSGGVSLTGGIRFTGHDGLLDTTVSNPTLLLAADGTARLLVDLTSVSMEDALAGAADSAQTFSQLPLVSLDLAASPLQVTDEGVSATDVPTAITQEGFEAFGSYEPGTAFDPVTFALALECADPAPASSAPASPAPEASAVAGSDAEPASTMSTAWLPWTLSAVALAVMIGFVAWLVRRTRPRRGDPGRAVTDGDDRS